MLRGNCCRNLSANLPRTKGGAGLLADSVTRRREGPLVLGVIYAYIYFTRINPRAANRAVHGPGMRKYVEPPPPVDDSVQTTSTHLFLFKKS